MYRLPSEKEEHKDTIGALILSIFIIIAGIGGMIYTKHESSEFKNSTDVRTLHATVYSCEQTHEKDDQGDRKEEYKVRFTYEIDGTTYDDFKTYSEKKREGDTVRIVVYRDSKGRYKLEPGPTPFYFFAFAAMIPLGLIGFIGLSKDLIKYHREEKEGRRL
ncbi:DUF3592 domain-containing protein [Coprococcus comes]|uniref:DUF3592 domain-containing protein n=1 Tax=Coprococcus comes TaxID=410072 RepID=UPI00156FE52A|nr:DUF3592 domain-containing protein [Coprococcus comes]NSF19318.1 DUF3592 domain-containing protein [Coprococcus comes]